MTVADDARELVRRTTEAQGVPEHVEDRVILRQVAAIVAAARNGNAGPHHKAGATSTINTTATVAKRGGHGDLTP